MTRWQRKSKKRAKLHLKILCESHKTPVSHNESKTLYISGASLYKELAAASEKLLTTASERKKVQHIVLLYVEDCVAASERYQWTTASEGKNVLLRIMPT